MKQSLLKFFSAYHIGLEKSTGIPFIDLYNTIFPKTKKTHRAEFLKLCGGTRLPSGTLFCLSPKELLGGHAPMNGNIVTVILPDLDPVHQLGNYQMLGFVACIAKAVGPA